MQREGWLGFGLALFFACACFEAPATSFNRPSAKHVMGFANVTATRLRQNGAGGAPLHLETLERIGYARTYSKTNTVADSSAAAFASHPANRNCETTIARQYITIAQAIGYTHLDAKDKMLSAFAAGAKALLGLFAAKSLTPEHLRPMSTGENLDYQFGEMKAVDEAVKVVLDGIAAAPRRKEDTLLLVLPGHETGGFAVRDVGPEGGEPPNAVRSGY